MRRQPFHWAYPLNEGYEFVHPPVLEAPQAGVGSRGAADLIAGPFRPLRVLFEGQGGIGIRDEFKALRFPVIEHFLEGGRQRVLSRVPLAFADLLAQGEPEKVLPAPGIGVLLEAGELAVGRGEQSVIASQLCGPVDDAFVFLPSFGRGHVDLVVVLAPGDVNADTFLGADEEECADAFDQGVDLGHVDQRVLGQSFTIIGDVFPFRDGLGGETVPAELNQADAEPVGDEGAVVGLPVHIRHIRGGHVLPGKGPGHEGVLVKQEDPVSPEADERAELAVIEAKLFPDRKAEFRGERLDFVDAETGRRGGLQTDLFGEDAPSGLQLIYDFERGFAHGVGEDEAARLVLHIGEGQAVSVDFFLVDRQGEGFAEERDPESRVEVHERGEAVFREFGPDILIG